MMGAIENQADSIVCAVAEVDSGEVHAKDAGRDRGGNGSRAFKN
jgi:hypothetical protein